MRLPVQRFGDPDGRELVCLHGLAGYGARFRRLSELLPGRLLVCPDLRGHGEAGRRAALGHRHARRGRRRDGRGGGRDRRARLARLQLRRPRARRPCWPGAPRSSGRACLLDPALSLPPAVCSRARRGGARGRDVRLARRGHRGRARVRPASSDAPRAARGGDGAEPRRGGPTAGSSTATRARWRSRPGARWRASRRRSWTCRR